MSPLRDAMGFVNGDKADLAQPDKLEKTVGHHLFR